jgi:hypothetical protein
MEQHLLQIPGDVHISLLRHLLPDDDPNEQAAFLFVCQEEHPKGFVFRLAESRLIGEEGLAQNSSYYLELADEERGRIIKRAHDLGASIVEMHSHRFPGTAAFSLSDRAGLREFVPHALWRLKRRPYIAVVVAPDSFDGLIWMGDAETPKQLDGLLVEDRILTPTRASLERWDENDDA